MWQNNACALRFWCIKCSYPKDEWIGQASKSNTSALYCHNSQAQSWYTVNNLIHTEHKVSLDTTGLVLKKMPAVLQIALLKILRCALGVHFVCDCV